MGADFRVRVGTVRIFDWLFSFVCKECENGAITLRSLLASNCSIDRVFTKTAGGMVLEVSRGSFIFGVLEAADTTHVQFALGSSTGKEVAWSAFVVLEGNIRFEKCIYRGAPSFLECL